MNQEQFNNVLKIDPITLQFSSSKQPKDTQMFSFTVVANDPRTSQGI